MAFFLFPLVFCFCFVYCLHTQPGVPELFFVRETWLHCRKIKSPPLESPYLERACFSLCVFVCVCEFNVFGEPCSGVSVLRQGSSATPHPKVKWVSTTVSPCLLRNGKECAHTGQEEIERIGIGDPFFFFLQTHTCLYLSKGSPSLTEILPCGRVELRRITSKYYRNSGRVCRAADVMDVETPPAHWHRLAKLAVLFSPVPPSLSAPGRGERAHHVLPRALFLSLSRCAGPGRRRADLLAVYKTRWRSVLFFFFSFFRFLFFFFLFLLPCSLLFWCARKTSQYLFWLALPPSRSNLTIRLDR